MTPQRESAAALGPAAADSAKEPQQADGERPDTEKARLPYDSIVVVSFGGPEEPDHVVPFLQNVTRGRGIPEERLKVVGEHYFMFGGKSPINDQNRALIEALRAELAAHNIHLPIYWGNRNWEPYLTDTVEQMAADGRRRALAFVTSAFGSYSGCRQYREDIEKALAHLAEHSPDADLQIDKLRLYGNHPGFVDVMVERVTEAIDEATAGTDPADPNVRIAFTAHSIPTSSTATSRYEPQLRAAAALVAERAAPGVSWDLVYQSRSGPPQVPWLEPDIVDHLRALHDDGVTRVVVVPIGFISDHMEVIYDLDTQAAEVAEELGMTMVRAGTAGTHARFIAMVRQLIEEQLDGTDALAVGPDTAWVDHCHPGCCVPPATRPRS